MKHSQLQIIISAAASAGTALPEDRAAALATAMAWLHPAAVRIGLTNYIDQDQFLSNLVLPVLPLLSPAAADCLSSPALDFGAGSGAVGLSLAVLRPDLEVVLADRRTRVVQFLDLAISRLEASNCRAVAMDLAAPPAEFARSCGTVLIRAFGPTEQALQYAERLIRPDGCLALWHQPPAPSPAGDLRQVRTLDTSVRALALTLYSH